MILSVMQTLTLIGHVAIDRVITGQGERLQLGGPPTYFGLVSKLLGYKPKVFTSIGGDIPDEYVKKLIEFGIDARELEAGDIETTQFKLDYTKPERKLSVESICHPIKINEDFTSDDSVILAPIIGEISSEVKEKIDNSVNALDPQGFLRRIDGDGAIFLSNWLDREMLHKIHVLKASESELEYISSENSGKGLKYLKRIGVEIPISTSGENGANILTEKGLYHIPSYSQVNYLDGTGAGDCFLSGFFSAYVRGDDPLWCGAVASATASAVVETYGPEIDLDSKELMRRAEIIYEGVIRLD